MIFGENLKRERKAKGLTQKELAQLIGSKHNSISNWENDLSIPKNVTFELICQVLDVEPHQLIGNPDLNRLEQLENKNPAALTNTDRLALGYAKSLVSDLGHKIRLVYEPSEQRSPHGAIHEVMRPLLPDDEMGLINDYRLLNDEGKLFIRNSMKMVRQNPDYANQNESESK